MTTGTVLEHSDNLLNRRNRHQFLATLLGEPRLSGYTTGISIGSSFRSELFDFCSWHRHRLDVACDESFADARLTTQLRGVCGADFLDRVSAGHWQCCW